MTPFERPLLRGDGGRPPKLLTVFGTRPEVIKLFPLLACLEPRVGAGELELRSVCTGQGRELVAQAMRLFELEPDFDLDLMRAGEPLESLHARLVQSLGAVLADQQPDAVLVQGDTLSAFSAALVAFYRRIPVFHVEAGLRTYDPGHPFPEETQRRFISQVAAFHFCPTERAAANLRTEGVAPRDMLVTGNTVIDAMRLVRSRIAPPPELDAPAGQRLFVTLHRRENFPQLEKTLLPALVALSESEHPLDIVFSVHPNPVVAGAVHRQLGRKARIHLREPFDYPAALGLMRQSALVLTDSGGLQEEAAAMGVPVLVLRRTTERYEAVDAGNALLVGTGDAAPSARAIAERILEVLGDEALLKRMAVPSGAFGDGRAAERIASRLLGES